MRTVLVCVRTPLAAQAIASCAARLGIVAVRTATTEPEVLARLGERPAELVLADTAVSRPDTPGFTQRVLARAPGATLVLFGHEEPHVAAAAVAAGARGLIRGDHDPVTIVAKAVLLIGSARRVPGGEPAAPGGAGRVRAGAGEGGPPAGAGAPVLAGEPRSAAAGEGGDPAGHRAPPVVPTQRGDAPAGEPLSGGSAPAAATTPLRSRRVSLTERELQVLQGMAEGKSNAEIGRELYVSEDTVKTHARRLFRKLGARDRAHAVAVGFRAGALR